MKAKVQINPDSIVQLHTANGIATGKRGRAQTIQLRSLQETMSQSSFRTMPRALMGKASMVCSV